MVRMLHEGQKKFVVCSLWLFMPKIH